MEEEILHDLEKLDVTKFFDSKRYKSPCIPHYLPILTSVLITGASGFLGKVLLEKLLFSLPRIARIYLLIRPLKGQEPKDRLEKLLEVRH